MTTTLMIAQDPAQVFERAADLIEANGLFKGDYWPPRSMGEDYVQGCPCCLFGAIIVAAGLTSASRAFQESFQPLEDALVSHWYGTESEPPMPHDIADWSDAPEREADEVVARLRLVAARVRGVRQ